MMKKSYLLAGFAFAAATALPSSAYAATYLPVGPQTNVALSTVTGGGWTQCYGASMGTPFGSSAASTLSACSGNRLLLAGRQTGSNNLLVLAQALTVDALFNTGAGDNGIFHNANGSDWFYADNWSWGFKTPGDFFRKFQCSFGTGPGPSMCVHTFSNVGGYSINGITGLNGSTDYEKLVFQFSDNAVPEPATWALMLLGFGAMGFAMRRKPAAEQRVKISYS